MELRETQINVHLGDMPATTACVVKELA